MNHLGICFGAFDENIDSALFNNMIGGSVMNLFLIKIGSLSVSLESH